MKRATVGEVCPPADRGSNVLVMGPTLSDTDPIAFELLGDSWEDGAEPFVITTADPTAQFRERYGPYVPPGKRVEDVFVIDCSEASGTNAEDSAACGVGTPADLTGIGICLSKGYDRYGNTGGRGVLLDNLATLLVYSDVDRVYRFVSAIAGRIAELGDTSVQVLDTDAIEDADVHKLLQLFPTVIEVRRAEADATAFRVRGGGEASTWYEYRGDER